MNESKCLVTIDDSLHFVLFGIQSAIGKWFSGKVIEKIFCESESDQVSKKTYSLLDSPVLQVTGIVEEYEPDSIWITVKSNKFDQRRFEEIIENASFAAYRSRKT